MKVNMPRKIIVSSELELIPPSNSHKKLVEVLFEDEDYSYFLKKETTPQGLVDLWIEKNESEHFFIWVITFRTVPVGYYSVLFDIYFKIGKIVFAIHPNYRNKGIATDCTEILLKWIERNGAITVHADVSVDNKSSTAVIEKFNFKRRPLLNGTFFLGNTINLWTKDFPDNIPVYDRGDDENFYVVLLNEQQGEWLNSKIEKTYLLDPSGPDYVDYYGINKVRNIQKMLNRHGLTFLIRANFEEIGIKGASYEPVEWELIRELHHKDKKYITIRVRSDEWKNAGSLIQYELAIPKMFIAQQVWNAMRNGAKDVYNHRILNNTLGLEGFVFGEMSIVHW